MNYVFFEIVNKIKYFDFETQCNKLRKHYFKYLRFFKTLFLKKICFNINLFYTNRK